MIVHDSFAAHLKTRLPLGCNLRVHHVSAKPTSCPPLFAAAPGQTAEETWCEPHFLALSQATDPKSGSEGYEHIIVLGIEVLIFTSQDLTTVFVSKADSTGFLTRQDASAQSASIAHATIAAFLEFLVQPRQSETRLVLSLFARSQNQYLFPGSIENDAKHVLDDRKLIKWWCCVLDTLVVKPPDIAELAPGTGPRAFVVVPGCDKSETKAFFPRSARPELPTRSRWTNDYPVKLLVQDASLPPRCLVPRLPDDPKSRFLDDLDESQIDEAGRWRGVRTLDQFWELMSYRQECSAGRLVGFVWVIFEKVPEPETEDSVIPIAGKTEEPKDLKDSKKTLETSPVDATNGHHPSVTSTPIDHGNNVLRQDPTTEADHHEIISTAALTREETDVSKEPLRWPTTTRGQLVLKPEDYTTLMDHLLQLDFAGEGTATQSTKDWIDKATVLSGHEKFGVQVRGQFVSSASVAVKPVPVVANVITAVRKKRKANANIGTADLEPAKKTQRADELILEVDSQGSQGSLKKVKS